MLTKQKLHNKIIQYTDIKNKRKIIFLPKFFIFYNLNNSYKVLINYQYFIS